MNTGTSDILFETANQKQEERQFVAIDSDITEQKRMETELAEKMRLQGLLAELSSHFATVQPEGLDAALQKTLRLVAETLGLDRSTLWQLMEHNRRMVPTHFWQRLGNNRTPSVFSCEDNLPWSYAKIMKGKMISFSNIKELPPRAARDKETFRREKIISGLVIPLLTGNHIFGALFFGTLGTERKWKADEIMELKLISQIIGNVMARQRAELREEQLRDELTHTTRVTALGELAAEFAHELNQPLTAILSNAQAALRFIASGAIEPEELRAILDDIVRDDKRAGSVIHNVRAMLSKQHSFRETCCLNEIVREAIELVHSKMIETNIDVRSLLAPDLPPVQVARVELEQVLMNLLVNAAHAMEAKPSETRIIEVETRNEKNGVTVTVRDYGDGIPPGQLPKIFNPFFSTKTNGLGMGLSICRRIIENHNGHIEAHNLDKGGASFSFVLPVPA